MCKMCTKFCKNREDLASVAAVGIITLRRPSNCRKKQSGL